ncbi:MAG: hypothetical protein H7Y31_17080 [Chitinophagaceae bacterium]|nr:hypothetical protein [Chitinophagaceae bacterium]
MRKKLIAVILVIVTGSTSFRVVQDWYKYSSKEGGYEITMPKKPEEQTRSVPTAVGNLTMHMAMLQNEDEADDNLVYMTAFSQYPADKVHSDLPKEQLSKFFQGAAEGSARNMNGKVTSVTETEYKGFPGRSVVSEVTISDQSFLALQRMFLVKNKFYMLQTVAKPGTLDNANSKKFFESFNLPIEGGK